MKAEDLRKVREAVPFRPFDIVLADGRAFPVPHPDFLSVAPRGTAVVLWAEDGGVGNYLDPALIAEVRMTPGNGNKRRRPR